MSINKISGLFDWVRSDEGIYRLLQWNLLITRVFLPFERQYKRQFLNQTPKGVKIFQFPRFLPIFRVYNVISAILLFWVLFRQLAPSIFNWIAKTTYYQVTNPLDGLEVWQGLHCFSFGSLVIHYDYSEQFFGCLLSAYHILWRLAEAALDRPFSLNVVLFLLQSKEDIKRFIERLEATNEIIQRSRRRLRDKGLSFGHDSQAAPMGLNYTRLTYQERHLCKIMCYKVVFLSSQNSRAHWGEDRPKILYKVRPNRTLEHRERLANRLASMSLIVAVSFGAVGITSTIYIATVVVFNQRRYANNFSGCLVEFSKSEWSLPQLTSHRLSAIIGDVLVNLIVWVESGLALVYSLTFISFLNEDLLDYWAEVDAKLQKLRHECEQMYLIYYKDAPDDGTGEVKLNSALRDSNDRVLLFQAEMNDFFKQIKQTDLFISDVISHGLLIWLTSFGYLSYKSADLWSRPETREFAMFCIGCCMIVFIGYSALSLSLLSLQRNCHSSYLAVCSMMAHDQSTNKENFLLLLQNYTTRNRTCYTLLQQYPFSSSNFLSFIGWSLTGFLILDSIYHR